MDIWICALASLLAWADRQAKGDACVMQMFVSEERPCVQGRAEMDLILRYVYGARMGFGLERAAGELLGCAAGLAPGVEDGPRGQIRCNNLAPLYLEVGASTRGTSPTVSSALGAAAARTRRIPTTAFKRWAGTKTIRFISMSCLGSAELD